MKITVDNKANVPNKYVRYINWRLHKLKAKYKDVVEAKVSIKTTGRSSGLYNVHVNVQASNNQFFVSKAGTNLDEIVKLIPNRLQYSLAKGLSKN